MKWLLRRRRETEALAEFLRCWSDGVLAHDIAERLNCTEVDAIVSLFAAYGDDASAEWWIKCHAFGDGEDDAHYTGD